MKCVYCKKVLDTTKANFGWHIGKKGWIEKCYFQNMPMQYLSKRFTTKKLKGE